MCRALLVFCLTLLSGCCTEVRIVSPFEDLTKEQLKRPKDMTRELLENPKIPAKFKKNYAEWLRYSYDQERAK